MEEQYILSIVVKKYLRKFICPIINSLKNYQQLTYSNEERGVNTMNDIKISSNTLLRQQVLDSLNFILDFDNESIRKHKNTLENLLHHLEKGTTLNVNVSDITTAAREVSKLYTSPVTAEAFLRNIMALYTELGNTLYALITEDTDTSCICWLYGSVPDGINLPKKSCSIYKISGVTNRADVDKRLELVETVSILEARAKICQILPECSVELYRDCPRNTIKTVPFAGNTLYVVVTEDTNTSCICWLYDSVPEGIEIPNIPYVVYKISGVTDRPSVKERLDLVESVSIFNAGGKMKQVLPECTIESYADYSIKTIKTVPFASNYPYSISEIAEKLNSETMENTKRDTILTVIKSLPNSSIAECKTSEDLIELINKFL
jgi:hypothetical protein